MTGDARALLRGPLPLLAALLFVYLLAPIVAFLVRLGGGFSVPSGMFSALGASLATASVATAIVLVLGTPLAYLLSRHDGVVARVLLALVALPLALPPLFSGILLLYVFGPLTFLGRLFGGGLSDSYVGIVLAQSFVAAPFLVIAARAAFASVDPALEDVAASLGHGRLARFTRVAAPAALPGIAAGAMLMWLRAFGEFGATLILAYHPFALPVFTYVQFDETGIPATLAPIAAALAAALLVLLAVQLRPRLLRRRRGLDAAARDRLLAAAASSSSGGMDASRQSLVGERAEPSYEGIRAAAARAATTPRGASRGTLDFALTKRLGSFSLELAHRAESERLALLGPSGAGKTLTLRMLAGLLASGSGDRVELGGERLDALRPERRGLGYVPQQPALLPRRTVWAQVNFGVGADRELAAMWISRLGLGELGDRYPEELSGGQQRRVALARALACSPRVLLLDEPFTGLDAPVRDRLRRDLRKLQREAGMSTVIVTHDPEEAALLADELLVIGNGQLLQAGTRSEVFRSPRSPEVAGLLGIANTHDGVVVARGWIEAGGVQLRAPTARIEIGSEVVWSVRPERIALVMGGGREAEAEASERRSSDSRDRGEAISVREGAVGTADLDSAVHEAILLDDIDLGAVRELTIELGGRLELTLRTGEQMPLTLGERIRIALAPEALSVWEGYQTVLTP